VNREAPEPHFAVFQGYHPLWNPRVFRCLGVEVVREACGGAALARVVPGPPALQVGICSRESILEITIPTWWDRDTASPASDPASSEADEVR
jgi:hypothetical protein